MDSHHRRQWTLSYTGLGLARMTPDCQSQPSVSSSSHPLWHPSSPVQCEGRVSVCVEVSYQYRIITITTDLSMYDKKGPSSGRLPGSPGYSPGSRYMNSPGRYNNSPGRHIDSPTRYTDSPSKPKCPGRPWSPAGVGSPDCKPTSPCGRTSQQDPLKHRIQRIIYMYNEGRTCLVFNCITGVI